MRFKKLIAAGGAFLLLVGASTIGAAAAYADDAVPPAETAIVEPAPEPVVEPAPAPAPEPVVEPAPEPVVEPAPEPASEPVVEPAEEPVPSDTPSGESDSDAPAGESTDSPSDFTDSGDAPVTDSVFTKFGFAASMAADPVFVGVIGSLQPWSEDTNHVEYWETEGVECFKDDTTYGSITDDGKTVTLNSGFNFTLLVVKGGNVYNNVVTNPASGVAYASTENAGGQQSDVSHWIVCLGEEEEDVLVTPEAKGSDETCSRDTILVGGTIQLTLTTGVTYTITGPNPGSDVVVPNGLGLATGLAPGDYNVAFVLGSGYTTSVVSPIVITIGEYDGECGEDDDISVTPAADGSDETCDEEENTLVGGSIQLTVTKGVTYTITGPGGNVPFSLGGLATGLEPGTYQVSFVLDSGYKTSVVSPIEIKIGGFPGLCGDVSPSVVPIAAAFDATCLNGGHVGVTPIPGVTYTITGPGNVNVPFSAVTGQTGPLAPGGYTVSFVLGAGYTSPVASPLPTLTIAAAGVVCDPSLSSTELTTLALTGRSPLALLGGAMVLILAGLAMFRVRAASRPQRPDAI